MVRIGVLLVAFFLYLGLADAVAQRKYKPKYNTSRKEKKEPFPNTEDYRPGGWLAGVGLTAMVGFESTEADFPDLNLSGEFSPVPLPGLMLEFGRYYNFERNIIFKYVDASIAYKALLGRENFTLNDLTTGATVLEDGHTFNQHFASINLNANSIIPLSNYTFLQSTIGVNGDIRFIDGFPNNYGAAIPPVNENAFVGQVHYKLGFGYALDTDLLLETSIETPVYTFVPNGTHFSMLDYYQTRYQPFIVRVRFLFFRLGKTKCPPVGNPQLPPGFENGYGD